MANQQNHIQQWKHNRDLLSAIPSGFPDWMVTVSFYVALHAVDSLLAFDGGNRVTCHRDRNEILAETNRYKEINRHYMPLHNLSRTVRYVANPSQWIPAADIEKQILRRYLYPLEKSVQKLTKIELDLPPVAMSSVES